MCVHVQLSKRLIFSNYPLIVWRQQIVKDTVNFQNVSWMNFVKFIDVSNIENNDKTYRSTDINRAVD